MAADITLSDLEPEQERLDMTHAMMVKGIGEKLFLCPIDTEKMRRVLDVIGNDLSPIQPPWVPPNVSFLVDDVESPWVNQTPFDFIFTRYLSACILDWPKLVGSIYSNLAPGGWAEFQDYDLEYYSEDGSLTPEHQTAVWDKTLLGAARQTGREPCPGPRLEGWVRDGGFVNVRHEVFRFPIGPWAKDRDLKMVGKFNIMQTLNGLEGFSLRLFVGVLGWRQEEVMVLLAHVRNEMKSQVFHAHMNFHVVYGQKPGEKAE
ncbi:hypothetical protein N0V88_001677 [Collariella sp. IMI 366227]|nr:hypothetical protein N0V88_001677 [Collariella sp. IMI 366227]